MLFKIYYILFSDKTVRKIKKNEKTPSILKKPGENVVNNYDLNIASIPTN
jgi:hypothetical protein